MRNVIYRLFSLIVIAGFVSCVNEVKEIPQAGNPVLEVENTFTNVHFGDLLPFNVSVSDDVSLSTLTAKLYFGEEKVSQTLIRTPNNGKYSGHIKVPFLKDIPDGTATLEFVLLNTTMKSVVKTFEVPVSRAKYPYLMLVTANSTYSMLPTGKANEYAVSEPFPSTDLPAYIKTPTLDDKGVEISFGWESGAITQGSKKAIPFVSKTGGIYTVSFNTKTYEAGPFFEILLNGQKMNMLDKENFSIDVDLKQKQEVKIEGLDDLAEWWIDVDYFHTKSAGVYEFVPIDGKYRITANLKLKYFKIEVLDGNNQAKLKADGTGAVWIIGQKIGKPSVAALEVGWQPSKALCMAPMGEKKFQITLVAGKTVNTDEINFKFFHQKGWGGEFKSETLTTESDIIFIGKGSAINGRDNGNLGIVSGKQLEANATYVFTIDVSAGIDKAVLKVEKK